MAQRTSVNLIKSHISLVTCVGLQEEPQTAYPMSFTWASHIATSMLTGYSTLHNQSTSSVTCLEFQDDAQTPYPLSITWVSHIANTLPTIPYSQYLANRMISSTQSNLWTVILGHENWATNNQAKWTLFLHGSATIYTRPNVVEFTKPKQLRLEWGISNECFLAQVQQNIESLQEYYLYYLPERPTSSHKGNHFSHLHNYNCQFYNMTRKMRHPVDSCILVSHNNRTYWAPFP